MSTVWKRTQYILCGVFAAISFGGCAELHQWCHNDFKVGPEYRKPAAPIADNWIDFNNPDVINQQHGIDDGAWWLVLNDPMLNQLVFESYQSNLDLQAAGMRVLEARARRNIAAGLLFPQTQELFGGYERVQNSLVGNRAGIVGTPIRTFDLWSAGLNVAWEIDVWGRFRRNIESAEATVDASIEDYDDILVCLIAETAAAYIEIRRAEQRIEFALENVESQRKALENALAFGEDVAGELDVTQARANLAQTEALIPELQQSLRVANNRLCVLMGMPPQDLQPELGVAPIPAAPPEVVVGIPAELLRRRPDIRRAERQVAAQSALIGVATADLFPAFSILGAIDWRANDFDDLFSSAAAGGFVAPGFNWKILQYGRLRNNIVAQDARFQELAILYQQAVLEANKEVEDAIIGYLTAQRRIVVLEEGVQAAERSVDIALTQYGEIGREKISFNRVATLQSTLTQQQDQLAVARADAVLSLVRIYKALGGGWQIRQCQPATFQMVVAGSDPAAPNTTEADVAETSEAVPPPVKIADAPAPVAVANEAGQTTAGSVTGSGLRLPPPPADNAPRSVSPPPTVSMAKPVTMPAPVANPAVVTETKPAPVALPTPAAKPASPAVAQPVAVSQPLSKATASPRLKPQRLPATPEPVRSKPHRIASPDQAANSNARQSSREFPSVAVRDWKSGGAAVRAKTGVVREANPLPNPNFPIPLYRTDGTQPQGVVHDVAPIRFPTAEGNH